MKLVSSVLKSTQKILEEGFILIPPPIKERSLFFLPEILCNALKRGEIWREGCSWIREEDEEEEAEEGERNWLRPKLFPRGVIRRR